MTATPAQDLRKDIPGMNPQGSEYWFGQAKKTAKGEFEIGGIIYTAKEKQIYDIGYRAANAHMIDAMQSLVDPKAKASEEPTYSPTLEHLARRVADNPSDPNLAKAARPFTVLQDRAKLAGIAPPTFIMDDDGGPSVALLEFCEATDLSLDQVFSGTTPATPKAA